MAQNKEWTSKRVDKFVILNKQLGEGSFSKVFRAFFAADETKLVAAKSIPLQNVNEGGNGKQLELIKREISILQKINNKHIVKLHEVARTSQNLYMFLEYCMDGDLKNYLERKEKCLSEKEAITFLRHIVEGFRELNSKKIVHRDIKPANIMLSEGLAKITDFGFAKFIGENYEKQTYLSRLGSPLYMAP